MIRVAFLADGARNSKPRASGDDPPAISSLISILS